MTLSYEVGRKAVKTVSFSPAAILYNSSLPAHAGRLPQGSAQLLIGHSVVLLPLSPHLGQGFRFNHPENALLPVFPFQDATVFFRRQKQVSDKFPQVRALEAFGKEAQ